MYLIGIDIGTSSTKGVLLDECGIVIAKTKRLHTVEYPHSGWAEHNADLVWWKETVQIIKELLSETRIPPNRIAAIGCSGVCPVILPLDKHGTPLRKAILYSIDSRSTKQIESLNKKVGRENIVNESGQPLSYQSIMPKLIWLKEEEPEVWNKTDVIIGASGYITYKLCSVKTVDHFTAANGGYGYSLEDHSWSKKAFQLSEIDIEKMPKLSWSSDMAGYLTAEAAEITGLIEGTPVITGTGDALAEMISTGVTKIGETAILYGSTITSMTTIDQYWFHEGFITIPGWNSKQIVTSSVLGSGMSLFSWYKRFLGESTDQNLFDRFEKDASNIDKGANGLIVLPYFTGQRSPILNPLVMGSIIGLSQDHNALDIFRALMEGLGYSLRLTLSELNDMFNLDSLRVIGGGVKSNLLLQIVSDITRREQKVVKGGIGAPVGVAWLAGYGVGTFESESYGDLIKIEKTVTYNETDSVEYDHIFIKFKETLNSLNHVYNSS